MPDPGQHSAAAAAADAVLEVAGLTVEIAAPGGAFKPVDGLSFSVGAGRTLGIVGESGCGKTMTALSLMRLQPDVARITGGSVRIDGVEITSLPRRQMEDLRGSRVSMIFQEPMTSLNPVICVGDQIVEALRRHRRISRADAWDRALEMLRLARLPHAEDVARAFPHRLSGGMRQRVMIAMALVCEPRLLIADEPTTALDVTIQAEILSLLRSLQQRLGTALVLITHDLGVIAETADHVIVMYAGRAVESAPVTAFFDTPLHPYTRGLMRAMPRLTADLASGANIPEIKGVVPPLSALPPGCAFAPRCALALDQCRQSAPELLLRAPGHAAACFRAGEWLADGAHG